MTCETLFSSTLISRHRTKFPPPRRLTSLGLALLCHCALVAAIVTAPLLVIEAVKPPEAGMPPLIRIDIDRILGKPGGDGLPAPKIKRGGSPSHDEPQAASPVERDRTVSRQELHQPPRVPLEPPEANQDETLDRTAARRSLDTGYGAGGPGHPDGAGTSERGSPYGCEGCIGSGPVGPGDGDGSPYIIERWPEGLTPPILIESSRTLPAYPNIARRFHVEGSVVLSIVVRTDGTVGAIEVVSGPDQRWEFDLAAIEAVKRWRYRPALMGGRPVAVYLQVLVEYTLSR